MPEISVIIPTFNYGKYIKRAIESILTQTYQDVEIIVVDDGSTDNTREIIRSKQSDKIRYFYQENKGAPSARNKGIVESKGKYIAFLDADDEWLPTKLEKQVDKFQRSSNKVALIYGWAKIIDEKGNLFMKFQSRTQGEILREILDRSFMPSSTVIVKKECFHAVGLFDENFTSCQDREMWTRIATQYQVEVLPEYLARIYRHSGFSIGASPKKVIYGYYQYFNKFQRLYLQQNMRKELSQNLSWIGYKLAKKGYKKEFKECFKLSFEYDKTNWKNYIRFFLSLINRKVITC